MSPPEHVGADPDHPFDSCPVRVGRWQADRQYLLFSDVPNNRIWKWEVSRPALLCENSRGWSGMGQGYLHLAHSLVPIIIVENAHIKGGHHLYALSVSRDDVGNDHDGDDDIDNNRKGVACSHWGSPCSWTAAAATGTTARRQKSRAPMV